MKLKLSLKNVLIFYFIIFSTFPILIIGYIALQNQSKSIEKEVTNKNNLVAKTISSDVERFLNDSLSFLKQIEFVFERNDIVTYDKINDYLLSIINNYEYFDMIRILDNTGKVIYHAPFDENINLLDMSNQNYFLIPKKTKKIFWSKAFISSQTLHPTLTVSLPMKHGVIIGHLNLSGLTKIVKDRKIGISGFVSIIDSDGTIIAHPNEQLVQERTNLYSHYILLKNLYNKENISDYRFIKEKKISSFTIIPETNWLVEISQNEDDAFVSIKRGRNIIIAGSFITILLSIIIGFTSLQKVLKSLLQLSNDSQRFAKGDYTHKPSFTPFLEINNLVNSFNIMIEAIKKRERELKKNKDNLEKTVKQRTKELKTANNDLESFNYSISHDLRTPLRTMEGFSKILFEDYSKILDEEGRNHIIKIINASKKMMNLINNILKLSRITKQEISIKKINLSNMIKNISIDLKNNEKDRYIDFIIMENIITKGDESLIEIAIQNLLSNAVKYTSKTKKAIIEFGAKKIKKKNTFYIKDNGAGFDMKYKENLFIPFNRLHSDYEFSGSGIGLSIVNRIISKHGGNIWAEGEEGKGATFYFTLG